MGEWAVRVKVPHPLTTPPPQGDLKVGQHGKLYHANARQLKPWRAQVQQAAHQLRTMAGGPLHVPVGVQVTFTVPRPATIPLRRRAWPSVRSAGDVDKLARAVLDGLTIEHTGPGVGLLGDDAAVCKLYAVKCYPDTPDAADRLPEPGAVIRVWAL